MTVNTTVSKIVYMADGATTVWSFAFAATGPADIDVFITDSFGHQTQQPTNAYLVTLNAPIQPNPTSIGGSVTFPLTGPPLAIGNSITIARIIVETQPTSISNQSIVYPPVVEQTFDRLVMMDQQISDQVGRSITVPISDPPPPVLPPAALRANTQAVFDSSGNMTAGGAVVGTIISAVMIPVVTAPTLPLARTAMAVPGFDSPAFTGNPTAPTATVGDSSNTIADTAFVMTAIAANGVAFTTGDLKPTHKTVADPGWILWIDGTIGNAGSGSSVRANADTSGLFALYYNGYGDTACPLLTSAGVATTRAAQGTAAAAFAAHCRMNLPLGSSRGIGLAGSGSGLSVRGLGGIAGNESVVMTIAQMPAHNHPASTSGPHFHNFTTSGHAHNLLANPHTHQFVGNASGVATGTMMAKYDPNANLAAGPLGFEFGIIQDTTVTGATDVRTDTGTTDSRDVGINVFTSGGSAAMNVMNPMAYINIMIKL